MPPDWGSEDATTTELLFAQDGSILSWVAQDGEVLFAVADETESHEHRFVLAREDLAPILRAAIFSGLLRENKRPACEGVLFNVLNEYVAWLDAQSAEDVLECLWETK